MRTVFRIVRVELLAGTHDSLIFWVRLAHLNLNHDGLLHLGRDNLANLLIPAGLCPALILRLSHGLERLLLGFPRPGLAAPGRRTGLGQRCSSADREHALAGDRLNPRYILLEFAQLLDAFGLAHFHLKAQTKNLLPRLVFLDLELFVTQVANLIEFHDPISSPGLRPAWTGYPLNLYGRAARYLAAAVALTSWRITNRVLSGSLLAASRIASCAISGLTPSISKSTLPGRTTATQ